MLLAMASRVLGSTGRNISTIVSGSESTIEALRDAEYPGTAVERMLGIRERVRRLQPAQLNTDWSDVRRNLLWAGGLRDLPLARPGEGYTGHSFADFNHCDLTAMVGDVSHNENEGKVEGIHFSNRLGKGIQIASITEGLGDGGSWSTCMMGCNREPPADVAHIQFKSRIAFKLVWSHTSEYRSFVLVDDAGTLLNKGTPTGELPAMRERVMNYKLCAGSKYAVEADKLRTEDGKEEL
jgi:hypothetical protein